MTGATFDVRGALERFLKEDIGTGDVTGALLPKRRITARIIAKERCVVAGAGYAASVFRMRRCRARALVRDGATIQKGRAAVEVSGQAARVLECERTALNIVSRMSGIATITREMASRAGGAKVYSTRKTAPGLRHFDVEAVAIGGGHIHRRGLYESIMIKDNHIAVGTLEGMMRRARGKGFEVEVESPAEAEAAARAGAAVIMLDNFAPRMVAGTVRRLERLGLRKDVLIEASGGITPRNVAAYGKAGADMISSGYVTSSARGIDYSLEVG